VVNDKAVGKRRVAQEELAAVPQAEVV
jgi:hypothetical protein